MNTTPHTLRVSALRWLVSGLLGLTFLLTSGRAQATAGSLSGKVTESASGAPLAGAIVSVAGTRLETTTDRGGEFYFSELPAGSAMVKVSYLGYPAKEFPVAIAGGQRASLDASLGNDILKLDTFKVEGQKVGQARALNQERASDSLKNIVAADALGRFPDQNAAEALGRISGISLQRDQGEGRFVLVRGIDPNLNMTTINGVVVPSTEGNERTINLDVIPSDSLAAIEVSKASTPDMEGGAIGGTVDLKTQSAFDNKGRVVSGGASLQYNKVRNEVNSGKADFSYSNLFRHNTLGFVVGGSFQRRDFNTINVEASSAVLTNSPTGGQFYLPSKYTFKDYHPLRDRAGINAALEFKPDADNYLFVRTFYSYFSDNENDGQMIVAPTKGTVTALSANQATVVVNKSGSKSKSRKQTSDLFNIAVGGEHTRNDIHWDWLGSFAYAAEETPYQIQATFLNTKNDTTTLAIDSSDLYHPVITQTSFTNRGDLSDPSGQFLDNFEVEVKRAHENQWAFQSNVQKDTEIAGHPGYWKAGLKYRLASKHYDKDDYEYTNPTLALTNFADRSSNYRLFRPNNQDFLTFKWAEMKDYFKAHQGDFILGTSDSANKSATSDFDTDENVLAGYVMGKVKAGKSTLVGGVRVEETFFTTRGYNTLLSASGVFLNATPVTFKRDYASVLPSVNYHYDFTDHLVFRASATRSISRPKLEDSAYRRTADSSKNLVTMGNPNLKPYGATNLDASLSYYMPHLGLVSAGVFYKDISDFIYSNFIAGGDPTTGFDLTTPLNGKRAKITGLELGWQQQMTFLPAPFDGLNLYANATFTDSTSTLGGGSPRAKETFPFSNQAKTIGNVALSYEKNGLLIRLAGNYNSSSLNAIGGVAQDDVFVTSHFQIDLVTRYRISHHWTVFANVTNLNNAPYHVHFGSGTLKQSDIYRYAVEAGTQFRF